MVITHSTFKWKCLKCFDYFAYYNERHNCYYPKFILCLMEGGKAKSEEESQKDYTKFLVDVNDNMIDLQVIAVRKVIDENKKREKVEHDKLREDEKTERETQREEGKTEQVSREAERKDRKKHQRREEEERKENERREEKIKQEEKSLKRKKSV